ncbi:MAG: glycosyltransferase family 2 protein, partial [Coriobacteriia bacterium]|nr:glycosyltransferase family 2 protein [Coriobacteriia bacterium]
MSVIALIPAHNEADRIGATVSAASGVRGIDRVIVIDDASADGTAALARNTGAEVIELTENLGKGGALQAGLDAVAADADIVVLLDGDLGQTAEQAWLLLAPVLAGDAAMTIATLPRPAGSGGIGLVKGLARAGIRALSGYEPIAPLSGQRVLSRAAWEAATPFARGYGVEVALTVRVARAGLRIAEVPTEMTHAATGRDIAGFAHRGRQFLQVAGAL